VARAARRRARFVSGEEMPLAAFVNTFLPDDAAAAAADDSSTPAANGQWRGYLAQHALLDRLPELGAEAPVPGGYIPAERRPLRQLWLGPEGTTTPLHRDPYHNLFCQARGVKRLRLYAAAQAQALYPFTAPHALRNTARVEALRGGAAGGGEDATQAVAAAAAFPAFAGAPYWEVELARGEALALPAGVWHAVRAMSTSLSVSYWWT
jgi:lysine-specific demethylase 8